MNYREENFESVIDPVDIVVDTVGGDTRHRSVDVLDENGELISVVGTAPEPIETETGNTVTAVSGSSNQPALLTTISEKIDAGDLRPTISIEISLSNTSFAHEIVETEHVRETRTHRLKLV